MPFPRHLPALRTENLKQELLMLFLSPHCFDACTLPNPKTVPTFADSLKFSMETVRPWSAEPTVRNMRSIGW